MTSRRVVMPPLSSGPDHGSLAPGSGYGVLVATPRGVAPPRERPCRPLRRDSGTAPLVAEVQHRVASIRFGRRSAAESPGRRSSAVGRAVGSHNECVQFLVALSGIQWQRRPALSVRCMATPLRVQVDRLSSARTAAAAGGRNRQGETLLNSPTSPPPGSPDELQRRLRHLLRPARRRLSGIRRRLRLRLRTRASWGSSGDTWPDAPSSRPRTEHRPHRLDSAAAGQGSR